MEYKITHQLICSNCENRSFSSSYGTDMRQNRISITCNRCGASTEVGQVPIEKDKNFNLVDTPTLEKSDLNLAVDTKHAERFYSLIAKDNTGNTDSERKSLFFIISGIQELYTKVTSLYDFKNHWIKDDSLEKNDFSNSTKKMVQLGFNLYNNSPAMAPLELFSTLDNDNYRLAMKAINIRFNKGLY